MDDEGLPLEGEIGLEVLIRFADGLSSSCVDIPPEFQDIIDEHFWDMV